MPVYRQISYQQKRGIKRTSSGSKKYGGRRTIPRGLKVSGVHAFKRMQSFNYSLWTNTGFSASNTVASGGQYQLGMAFSLGQTEVTSASGTALQAVAGASEFSALFDQWKIDRIVVRCMFSNNNSSINSPATCLPVMYTVIDHDGAGFNDTVTGLQQFHNCRVHQLGGGSDKNSVIYRKFSPRVGALGITSPSGATSLLEMAKSQWIDCSTPNAVNYGFKIGYDNSMNATVTDTKIGEFNFVIEIFYALKNSR